MPYKNKEDANRNRREWRLAHLEEKRLYDRERYKKDRNHILKRARKSRIKLKYNMTPDQYERLKIKQNYNVIFVKNQNQK